jgi:valyl-tRNA synthetase
MSEPLAPRYDPKTIDTRLYPIWESKGYFRPQSDKTGKAKAGKPYVIVIPPPNVTGILHMGHALNNTIQDILTRWQRMKGRDALWVPGVDHAGIATQNVVEKKLAKEKKTRHDLGRENFLKEVWKWKEEHGNTITQQLRRLGASCDWSREAFTMSPELSKAVRETFVTLHERGLIYQGYYIINWCPRCQTALSDEESAHKEVTGGLYHLKYPLAGKGKQAKQIGIDHIVVATTRPETMLGDTAVAVHPEDERYKHLIGKKVVLPLVEREIPIIGDEFVDREFGTGFVKVTPAHDPNDFEMGRRHNLPQINVMHPDGKINEQGGPYKGMDRFAARKKVIEDLEAQNLFVKRDSHSHAVGHCYRCDTVVEPYLSKQWFVKMKSLAEKALKAHREGKTVFYPDRWTKVYTNWLEGIRDWCISRQIWWGHQIPVWYCQHCVKLLERTGSEDSSRAGKGIIVSRETPTQCPSCGGSDLKQDPDVLDTWFSSWLWPFSTLGWPEKTEDLKHFYPTSDLVTAAEIIFFWVSRMIMAGLEFMGEVPFSRIYIHGTVRAQSGLKMSKSLGNSIDPLEVIDEMGADALRYSMIMLSAQDVYLSREKFEVGRNFVNKLWNASRFAMMNLEGFKEGSAENQFDLKKLPLANRWILSRLDHISQVVEKELSVFGMAQATTELYHFVWNDFCDWYIELAKPTLTGTRAEEKQNTQKVLFFVLERILRLLHPFMPFVTEEIWQKLKDYAKDAGSWSETIMTAAWPLEKGKLHDTDAEYALDQVQKAVAGIRDLRTRLNIPPAQQLKAVIASSNAKLSGIMTQFQAEIQKLGRLESLDIQAGFKKSKTAVGNAFPDFEVFIQIEGIVDTEKERVRIEKKVQETLRYVQTQKSKLSNENFVKNAPAEIVESEREKLADAEKVLKSHEELLELFK